MSSAPFPELILASTSRYRKTLLQRLGLPFHTVAPETDETPLPGERAEALAERLATLKASNVAERYPQALVIGSDQTACGPQGLLSKPGTEVVARQQLSECRGVPVMFYTGISLQCSGRALCWSHVEPFEVLFRDNSDADIGRYVARERPLDCAGSFKCEALGVALFESLNGNDPSSLEGLPLIALCRLLRVAGVDPLSGTGLTGALTQ